MQWTNMDEKEIKEGTIITGDVFTKPYGNLYTWNLT